MKMLIGHGCLYLMAQGMLVGTESSKRQIENLIKAIAINIAKMHYPDAQNPHPMPGFPQVCFRGCL